MASGRPGGNYSTVVHNGVPAASGPDSSGKRQLSETFDHDGDGPAVLAVFEMVKVRQFLAAGVLKNLAESRDTFENCRHNSIILSLVSPSRVRNS
jgi:hypothetical protein